MQLFAELTGLMGKHAFSPKKALGQHFIVSEELIKRIVEEAKLSREDVVLEIGSGTGFLTREIQKHCRVIAIEIDERLCQLLEQELEKKNLELLCADFLQAELPSFNKIVAFPPYAISSKIMQRLFSQEFDVALLVFQKEFVEKLFAEPGFFDYNAMSVLTQYYFSPSIVCAVSKNCFFPKPQSDSLLIKLVSKKRFGKAKQEQLFQLFVKSVFRFGNKNLRKALHISLQFFEKEFNANKKEFEGKTEQIKIKEKKVNLLEVREFVDVFNYLF